MRDCVQLGCVQLGCVQLPVLKWCTHGKGCILACAPGTHAKLFDSRHITPACPSSLPQWLFSTLMHHISMHFSCTDSSVCHQGASQRSCLKILKVFKWPLTQSHLPRQSPLRPLRPRPQIRQSCTRSHSAQHSCVGPPTRMPQIHLRSCACETAHSSAKVRPSTAVQTADAALTCCRLSR